jgi:hypothetical protein
MATSEVEICRNALLLLGDATISSLDETDDRVVLVNALWPNARDAVLRSHPWNCAVKRVALAPDATAPGFDYSARFQLPGDCLRVLSVGQRGQTPKYEIEDGFILMDDSVCYLRYIFRNEVVSSYDSLLVMALESYISMLCAYPITKSSSQQENMQKLYNFQVKQARTVDGQEQPTDDWTDSPLLAARRSS